MSKISSKNEKNGFENTEPSIDFKRKMGKRVVAELREMAERPFEPTADIDMVWVISAPGTAKRGSSDGAYAGDSSDMLAIDYGVNIVQAVTALKTEKNVDEITRLDILEKGPKIYYNGEDMTLPDAIYPQNEDFRALTQEPDFPLPPSSVIIDTIEKSNTPAQFEGFIKYLKENSDAARKIAIVSVGAHSARVSRYLNFYKDQFPKDIEFVNAPAQQIHNPVGTTVRELRKVIQYAHKGHMTEDPYPYKQYE